MKLKNKSFLLTIEEVDQLYFANEGGFLSNIYSLVSMI